MERTQRFSEPTSRQPLALRLVNLNALHERPETNQMVRRAAFGGKELTERGGEGMAIKPKAFIAKSRLGIAQAAAKCRGREYLRIIYGPEYAVPANLERL